MTTTFVTYFHNLICESMFRVIEHMKSS